MTPFFVLLVLFAASAASVRGEPFFVIGRPLCREGAVHCYRPTPGVPFFVMGTRRVKADGWILVPPCFRESLRVGL